MNECKKIHSKNLYDRIKYQFFLITDVILKSTDVIRN